MMQPKFIQFLASLKATKEEIIVCNITLGLGQVAFGYVWSVHLKL